MTANPFKSWAFGALTFLLIRGTFERHNRLPWGKGVPPTSQDIVSQLLVRWNARVASARDALVPFVYDELRRIARRCLAGQARDHTLQPTALVHEAYLRLARRD